MYPICEHNEVVDNGIPELVNTDALISDFAFQYRICRMNQKLDIDYVNETNPAEE